MEYTWPVWLLQPDPCPKKQPISLFRELAVRTANQRECCILAEIYESKIPTCCISVVHNFAVSWVSLGGKWKNEGGTKKPNVILQQQCAWIRNPLCVVLTLKWSNAKWFTAKRLSESHNFGYFHFCFLQLWCFCDFFVICTHSSGPSPNCNLVSILFYWTVFSEVLHRATKFAATTFSIQSFGIIWTRPWQMPHLTTDETFCIWKWPNCWIYFCFAFADVVLCGSTSVTDSCTHILTFKYRRTISNTMARFSTVETYLLK